MFLDGFIDLGRRSVAVPFALVELCLSPAVVMPVEQLLSPASLPRLRSLRLGLTFQVSAADGALVPYQPDLSAAFLIQLDYVQLVDPYSPDPQSVAPIPQGRTMAPVLIDLECGKLALFELPAFRAIRHVRIRTLDIYDAAILVVTLPRYPSIRTLYVPDELAHSSQPKSIVLREACARAGVTLVVAEDEPFAVILPAFVERVRAEAAARPSA